MKFRSGGDPVLYLSESAGLSTSTARRRFLDDLAKLNQAAAEGVSAIPRSRRASRSTRWRSGCKVSVPELTDLSKEPEATFEMYGPDARKPGTLCGQLPAGAPAGRARRALHPALPSRLGPARQSAAADLAASASDTDQPSAALVQDLKQRGLLDDTLVVWGGEFGRTVYCQGELTRNRLRPRPSSALLHHLDGRRRRQARHDLRRDRRLQLQHRRGPGRTCTICTRRFCTAWASTTPS